MSMAVARYPCPHPQYYPQYPPPHHFMPGPAQPYFIPPPAHIARPPVPPPKEKMQRSQSHPAVSLAEEVSYQTSVPPQPDRGPPLLQVRLPISTISRFISIAAVNTSQDCETCGLLLGKRRNNKYYITTLLIPRQKGTPTSCAPVEEDLVLGFQEERKLLTLGWVSYLLLPLIASRYSHPLM